MPQTYPLMFPMHRHAAMPVIAFALIIGLVRIAAAADQGIHPFDEEDRSWWAIQAVPEVAIPESGAGWARNPIDRFIARKQEQAGLSPAPVASRAERVRRLYFDLHGLPPTPQEVAAFLNDKRPDAWQRLIDQLLESPRYGERWAQHWLDVVRYAESDGYREDAFRPSAYAYRDYVIRQFNEDKPYDAFVREQLAGDELHPDDPDRFIGAAFLRHGIYEWNQRNVRMHWELIMNEMTRVTGEAFLGLGIGCAQCHDHKFDPILQKDYYAMQAFLSSTTWPLEAWLSPMERIRTHHREQAKWEAATADIREAMHELIKPGYDGKVDYTVKQFPEDIQAIYHKSPEERSPYEEQLAYLVERQVARAKRAYDGESALKSKPEQLKRFQELKTALKSFDDLKPDPLPQAFVARDVGSQPVRTYIKTRSGNIEVDPGTLTLLDQPTPAIQAMPGSTGRRTALANWITDPRNPLSTRVIVNRIWQHHFGRGIVRTPNDFGRLGDPPTHPELLDWLTARFIAGGWKFKPLHKLILNSATYRQTARREPSEQTESADAANRLLWRFPPRRRDAEAVRDGLLAVTGELKHRTGGPSVSGTSPYRSIYVKKLRNTPDEVLSQFDAPAGFESMPDRIATTTPLQSLLLINSDWVIARSRAFADRLLEGRSTFGSNEVVRAYQLAFSRAPSPGEIASALQFIAEQEPAVAMPQPKDAFPDETGLRPITQQFKQIEKPVLGDKALWLQPGSRFERLEAIDTGLSGDEFTVEAVANLDRLYPDASVNTLVSRWDSSRHTPGWSIGVTSKKSAYEPRNFIIQLVGLDFQGNPAYEVVASNLRVPLHKPVYLAASISTAKNNQTKGRVTFLMKDLSDASSPPETATIQTDVVGGFQNPKNRLLVGGRDAKGHLWDGQLAWLRVSRGASMGGMWAELPANQIILDWRFRGEDGEEPAPGTAWLRPTPPQSSSRAAIRLQGAVADFCQALLNSNEFLYLH